MTFSIQVTYILLFAFCFNQIMATLVKMGSLDGVVRQTHHVREMSRREEDVLSPKRLEALINAPDLGVMAMEGRRKR